MPHRVFVDADVLASRTPYEWLALLRDETDGAFRLQSSSAVVADAVRLWRAQDPVRREAAAPRRLALLIDTLDEVMDTIATDAASGPASQVSGSAVGDAVAGGAHVLLTSHVRATGDEDRLPFEVWTSDEFLCRLDDEDAAAVGRVTAQRGTEPLADLLIAAGCPAFAERVASHLREITR